MYRSTTQKSLTCFVAFVLAFYLLGSCFFQASPAYAITEETEAELTETQKVIEETAKVYDDAIAKLDDLKTQIKKNKTKIDELEELLPEQQEKSDGATVALYKMQQEGFSLIDMVLNSGSLEEFIANYEYVTQLQQANFDEINRLNAIKSELEETKTSLEESKTKAEEEKTTAEKALEEAQAAREAAQQKAEEEAAAEAAAAAAAIAAAEAQAQTDAQSSGSTGGGSSASAPSSVNWSTDKESFVNEWAARIDSYLSGTPTAGYGRVYAEAAWNYGVDPRYSPAISNTESSKGQHCFRPYNAWGWMGNTSWTSWEQSIDAHVAGLARGYSYTICIADAQKYCPPTWQSWYSNTLNQINMI